MRQVYELSQLEVTQAVVDYMGRKLNLPDGTKIAVDFDIDTWNRVLTATVKVERK